MGIKSALLRWLSKDVNSKLNQKSIGTGMFVGGGTAVPMEGSLQAYVDDGYLYNHLIYSVITKVLDASGNVPLKVYEVKDENKFKQLQSNKQFSFKASKLQSKALHEVEEQTQTEELLNSPNQQINQLEFETALLGYLKITGNTYMLKRYRSGSDEGLPMSLHVLPAHEVQISADEMGIPTSYRINIGTYKEYEAQYVKHIKYFNPAFDTTGEQLYGASPLQAGRLAATHSNDAMLSAVKMLQNQFPPGLLVYRGENPNHKATVEATDRARDELMQRYSGIENKGIPPMVSQPYDWIQMSLNSNDLELYKAQIEALRNICRLYNISSQLMGDPENSTYNNINQAEKSLYTNAVMPDKRRLAQCFTYELAQKEDKRLVVYPDISGVEVLQQDFKEKADALSKIHAISPNEQREELGFGRRDDEALDEIYIPANMIPISMSGFTGASSVEPKSDK